MIEAVECGAKFILTPEVSNCIAASKTTLSDVLHFEQNDPFLARMKTLAETHEVSILIGSLGVKSEAVEGKFANRSFLIDQMGKVVAKYDKIHMFDVDISETEMPALADGDKQPFQQKTFTLHDEQAEEVEAAISKAKEMGHAQSAVNENSNGNALAFICQSFNRANA